MHAQVQRPAAHTLPGGQALPHMPQCAGVVWRLTHVVPHGVIGAMHEVIVRHIPPVQV